MKRKAIIFDIDGTLADISHRLHYIQGPKKDYDAFYKACVDDKPKEDVIALSEICRRRKTISRSQEEGNEIIFCSGRPDNVRVETWNWLLDFAGARENEQLYMRRAGDYRADYIVKEEILREIQKTYDILFTVDDRQQVVDMWRRNGITCLQCEQWEEKPKVMCEPGKLYLMVGPSGAGKTSFLQDWFCGDKPHLVIQKPYHLSSDNLREEFTGSFKDQSQNDQVFSYIHETVKTRIKHGLDTLVDATNIRNKDRKAITSLVPANTSIFYIVVDRPLKDKIETGGWRTDVVVQGMPLIEKHHQVFQSNLKDILAGDNDPRVTVIDERVK
mgnify:FL=1